MLKSAAREIAVMIQKDKRMVKNADYGSWDALALAVAPHQILQRPQRNGRLAELERRRRVA